MAETLNINITADAETTPVSSNLGNYERNALSTTMVQNFRSFLRHNIKEAENSNIFAYAVVETGKTALNILGQAAETTMNAHWMLEEDYMGQTNMNNAKAVVNVAKNIGSSVITGASAGASIGSALGPIGTVVGGILGGAVGLLTSGYQQQLQAHSKLTDEARSLENQAYSQYFNGVRYGLINGSRGTDN